MKFLRFAIILFLTVSLTVALDSKIGILPPLGNFFDPFKGFWQNIESGVAEVPAKISLKGLKSEVEVKYDDHLIPHIFADNNHDLYFMQGYIAGSQRLWQMEFLAYLCAGRLSEIIGEKALDFDRLQRRKGLVWGAQNAVKAMKKDTATFRFVQAYIAGINAYIASLDDKNLPIEYKLLDYKPETWTPLKTALLLKLMADDLAGWDCDFENTNALNLWGRVYFDLLFPDLNEGIDPVIPVGKRWDFVPVKYKSENDNDKSYQKILKNTPPKPHPENGSNNWAVGSKKSATGKPILANDTHLGLNLPSIWFFSQLQSPDVNVFGASIPGFPDIIIGFNDSIAWGLTNAPRDVKDWYHIVFKDSQNSFYKFDNQWLKTEKRVEKISIRGSEDFHDTVYYTRHGPIVYDHSFRKNGEKVNFALRWIAHDPSIEQKTFFLLNRAKNYHDFVEAIQYYHSPAQNIVFASHQGDIALWVQGKFPAKWKEQGKFILDGADPDHEWQTFIPQSHNAHIFNPDRGFVSSANQSPVDTTYPYYTYDGRYEFFRNRSINQKLVDMKQATPQDMMQLQNDNYNLKAAESLPFLLNYIDIRSLDARYQKAYHLLQNWNFYSDFDKKAPSIFSIWWKNFCVMLWDEFVNDSIALLRPDDYVTLTLLKSSHLDALADIKGTKKKEDLNDVIQASFINAIDSLEKWQAYHDKDYYWGDFKDTKIQHIASIDAFSITDIEVHGDKGVINANGVRHGVSLRIVVSLEDRVKAWGIYPGGQSGNPGSPNYDNFVELWRQGSYISFFFMKDRDEKDKRILFSKSFLPTSY